MRQRTGLAVALIVATLACRPSAREYELRGVVVAVDSSRQEITIKHEDIPRFMPGMTMPFKVRDARLLKGRVPGDLVRATLVVQDSDAHLRTLERTGSGPVPTDALPLPLPAIVDVGAHAPDATFTDQAATIRHLSDWRGRALAVTFVYTRCPLPNFCPLMDRNFTAVQERATQETDLRGRVHLLSVSIDPIYDRPSVLGSRAKQLSADPAIWTFLTGEREEIDRFASRFGVSTMREQASAEEIVHNLRTAVIDPEGRVSAILRGSEWTPEELVAELRKALARR